MLSSQAHGQVGSERASGTLSIDASQIERHARVLSEDRFGGRGTGTHENAEAAAYIATACSDMGLRPFGPEYLLSVPMKRGRVLEDTDLSLTVGDRTAQFFHGTDFLNNFTRFTTFKGFLGSVVLVGTDDDIRSAADAPGLTGVVAVTLGMVTQAATDSLAARGAVGVIHLTSDEAAFEATRFHLGPIRGFLQDPLIPVSYAPALSSLIASPRLSRLLYQAIISGDSVRVRYALSANLTDMMERNVACLLPGTDSTRGIIAFTAHYDHLGVRPPDVNGDSIFNGFSDNAAGVAMLLALAGALSESRPFRSDIAFLFFTGEELGLLGSDYFVANPPFPLEHLRAVINLDAGAPPAPPQNWRIAGGDSTALGALALETARAQGWTASVSPAVPNSDYFPFFRHEVPSIFLIPGSGPYDGLSADSSDALRERWDRYHRADDEWHPDFPFSGLARYAQFALLVAQAVDTDDNLNLMPRVVPPRANP